MSGCSSLMLICNHEPWHQLSQFLPRCRQQPAYTLRAHLPLERWVRVPEAAQVDEGLHHGLLQGPAGLLQGIVVPVDVAAVARGLHQLQAGGTSSVRLSAEHGMQHGCARGHVLSAL